MIIRRHATLAIIVTVGLSAIGPAHAISVGELDDFSATLEGWTQGTGLGGISRPTANGPGGASDAYMQVVSGAGGRSKLVAFNQTAAWAGNYVSTQISAIGMDVNNLGATNLQLRLTFGTAKGPNVFGSTWFTSTSAISVPAASGWQHIQFPIAAADLSRTTGSGTYAAVMGGVATMRLLHATSLDDQGTPLTALLGVDNIKALGPPIPGDFDHMNGVTAADLAKWRDDYGGAGSDADGDLLTDGDDFLIWQRNLGMGTSVPAATAIPEPSGTILASLTAIAAALGLRRRSYTSSPAWHEEAGALLYGVRQMGRLGHRALFGVHHGAVDRPGLGDHGPDVRFQ